MSTDAASSALGPSAGPTKSDPESGLPPHLQPAVLEELLYERLLVEEKILKLLDFELELDESIASILDMLHEVTEEARLVATTCFERAQARCEVDSSGDVDVADEEECELLAV